MIERGRGHLLYVSSLSGKVASTRSCIYSATKFGLRGFASGVREDLHGTGVGVTVVFPSFIARRRACTRRRVSSCRAGSSLISAEQVATAVVRGIEEGRDEIDVAPLSLRAGRARVLARAQDDGAAAAAARIATASRPRWPTRQRDKR